MEGFLRSLGLSDLSRFDMDFSLVAMDEYEKGKVNMMIEKDSLWDFDLLDDFIYGLSSIQYPYTIRFFYPNGEATVDDFAPLFEAWYVKNFYVPVSFRFGPIEINTIEIDYESEKMKEDISPRIADFREVLSLINYKIKIVEVIKPTPKEEKQATPVSTIEEEQPKEIEEPLIESGEPFEEKESSPTLDEFKEEPQVEVTEEVEDSTPIEEKEEELPPMPSQEELELMESEVEEEDYSYEPSENEEAEGSVDSSYYEDEDEKEELTGEEMIRQDAEREQRLGEEHILEEQERNLHEWEEAQRRARVFKKGDYEVYDSIDDIFALEGNHNVDFVGEVFSVDPRLTKRGKQMNRIGVSDGKNAIVVSVMSSPGLPPEKVASIAKGTRVRIRGGLDEDSYNHQKTIFCHFLNELPPKEMREDPEPIKRVELHLHTKMSTMDGVSEIGDYVKLAKHMGMTAIAVTDHGSLQSLPAAQEACAKAGIKPIYGVEVYMVDLAQKYITNPSEIPLKDAKYCVFDTETTGLVPRFDRVVEFGGLVVQNGQVIRQWNTYIDPKIPMSEGSKLINHITDDMLEGQPSEEEILPKILEMFEGCILVAHNATFDIGFINAALERHGYPPISNPIIDTLALSHYLFPEKAVHNEGAMLRHLGLNIYNKDDAHEAIYDASKLNEGWQSILTMLEEQKPGIRHCDLASLTVSKPDESIKDSDPVLYKKQFDAFHGYVGHLREKHATVLVKNAAGLRAVNRIISLGETDYLSGSPLLPRTPRDLLNELHENILIGSACQNGEIFDMAQSESVETLAKAMEFYDFIEIQPLSCYSNLLNMGEIRSKEQLLEILNSIIQAAKLAGKPVIATGDCHYVNPEDKLIRDVYITAQAIGKRNHPLWKTRRNNMPWFDNPDQHLRSTAEMIADFAPWLGEEYAREIVVTNSNLIADQIGTDAIPVSKDTFTPNENLPNSEKILRDLCEKNFQDRYGGNPDPEVQKRVAEVHERLSRELSGIIDHGYAVTYYIAHCLIKMAAEEPEHYIVGSRGSVGSSFAATMADITEVNPLPPHYRCPKCHYFEWGDTTKYKSGFDMPDKECPHCHEKLEANGQNIPFQTFLGFNAEKVPDIDLNFEDESQHKAHNYTKILLGANKVFRAGTIEKVAEKTAYGYVKHYYEVRGKDPNELNGQWINFLASKVEGVKRTTGQHPGGIVVVPKEHDVTDFTAIQHPADDLNSEWLTTHYDYRSMHDELLKLDILGHVDPMAMRYYRDLTKVPIESIPMNDPRVLSLFVSPKELNLHENYLGLQTGALAIPEFGTRLAQQMLNVASPRTFNDLLIISGLAHGTNVWSGNAEDLITSGTTDINGVIGCRDDIMTYLIAAGIDNGVAFKIMETVRKGNFRKKEEEFLPIMREAGIPEWYIESCRKIAYLFPRGHATAYVMMAVRVAWFKLYYPLEFYSVFFSIRSDDWDIETMIAGEEAIKTKLNELNGRRNDRAKPLSNKEINILATLTVALEMVERGYSFSNISLYKSDGKMFIPDHYNKCLIPPFSVIDGCGVAAGNSVVEARNDGKPFLSKEDLLARTKLSRTNVDDLINKGGMEPLRDRNQMSLFEFL